MLRWIGRFVNDHVELDGPDFVCVSRRALDPTRLRSPIPSLVIWYAGSLTRMSSVQNSSTVRSTS